MNKKYLIEYYEDGIWDTVKSVYIVAKSKEAAYFAFIRKNCVYAAWVAGYVTADEKIHTFNTFCGKPY